MGGVQNDLGLTLWRLGESEDGTARSKEAVLAFQAALQERSRDRAPIQWAMTQCALGFPLARIAEREGEIGLLIRCRSHNRPYDLEKLK